MQPNNYTKCITHICTDIKNSGSHPLQHLLNVYICYIILIVCTSVHAVMAVVISSVQK